MKINYNLVQDRYLKGEQIISKGNGKYFCICCKKTLDEKQFFKSSRNDKHPSGYLPECKTCLTMGVVDTDPSSFLSILKEIDVPYIPGEWRTLLSRKDARSNSILGKYISKMRLNQFKKYSWCDTDKLAADEADSILQALRQETDSETEAEQKLNEILSMSDLAPANPMGLATVPNMSALYGLSAETSEYGLTQEEINELKVSWGPDYNERDFLDLEQQFTDMKTSYVIQDPVAIKNAKLICKMTLKMNKYLDIDDIESVSKISRQLDLFIKTANLAPVQQKDRQQTTFAISQLAYLVEKEGGFIPTFFIDTPNDKLDMLLRDMETYTQQLILGETNIAEQVENAATILAQDELPEELDNYDVFASLEEEMMGFGEEEEDASTD